jgi:hypothetical protein
MFVVKWGHPHKPMNIRMKLNIPTGRMVAMYSDRHDAAGLR